MSASRKSIIQRLEPPLIVLLVAVLALLIWRPWHRSPLTEPFENQPAVNKDAAVIADGGKKDGATSDGVKNDGGRKDGAPSDRGSFFQFVKPNEWDRTDSKGRLTGAFDFVKPGDPEDKFGSGEISGRTHDGQGNWLAGCNITLTFFLLQAGQPQRTQVYREGHSDSAGIYLIAFRYPKVEGARAWLTVSAFHEGYTESDAEGRDPAGDLTGIQLKVSRPCHVQGIVLDDDDKPLADARVYFLAERIKHDDWPEKLVEPGVGGVIETRSGPQGVFALDVAEKFYSVAAGKDGYAAEGGNIGVTAKSGETVSMPRALKLRKVAELRLRVANLAEKMPDLTQIEAKFFDGEKPVGTQLLQGRGDAFSGNLPSIAPGTYRLELWEFRGKRLLTIAQVEVKARAATDLGDIRIEPEK